MAKSRRRWCARIGCRKTFQPVSDIQLYCSAKCKNAAAQKRLRQRAKAMTAEVANG